jgi:hypothetical protein
MSDLHARPLLGRDMPEVFPRMREKARVYWPPGGHGWYWEHQCAPGYWKDSGFPYMARESAQEGALRHLKECC